MPEYEDENEDERTDLSLQDNDEDQSSVTPKEGERLRNQKAAKFFSLDANIQTALEKTTELMRGKKERYGGCTYICFNELENDDFLQALRNINRYIAEAQTLFDSEIALDKSTPKFENYLNLFYRFFKNCITRHTQSMFFQIHERSGDYLYDYDKIKHGDDGLDKLSMLLSRVQGTLRKSGEYIRDQPLRKSSASPEPNTGMWGGNSYGSSGYQGYTPAYPPAYPQLPNSSSDRPIPEQRDIGDVLEGTP